MVLSSERSSDSVESPFLFVTLGTDHHGFDRLIAWVDAWLEARGADGCDCLMQTGYSSRPRFASSVPFLTAERMERAITESALVVAHGGAGTIVELRKHGRIPIIVPRRPELKEHVNDHQVRFSARLAALGQIIVPESRSQLWDCLDTGVADQQRFRALAVSVDPAPAVQRFEEAVSSLFVIGRRERRRRRALQRIEGSPEGSQR